MELALFAIWCFTVATIGGLVGLVLGNIRLPFTLTVGVTVGAATGANLLISASAAAAAGITHIRAGRINWRLFWWLLPPSVVFAFVGGYVSGILPRTPLLLIIATVLVVSGLQMLGWQPIPERDPQGGQSPSRVVVIGAVVGFIGGVVGLILGSLRVPALIRLVGERPSIVTGTNLAVGFFVGIAGAIGHLPSEPPDWDVAAVGIAASVPGAIAGARLTGRLSEAQLLRAIACIVIVAGLVTGVEAVA
jgi:uncharacterized membrane protein YfcA